MDSDSFIPQFWKATRILGLEKLTSKFIETGGIKLAEIVQKPFEKIMANTIGWYDSEGNLTEFVRGWKSILGEHTLTLGSGSFAAYLSAIANDNIPELNRILATADGYSATILDGEGRSQFLQLPNFENLRLVYGAVLCEAPGGTRDFNTVVVNHGLGNEPFAAFACAVAGGDFASGVICNIENPLNETQLGVHARLERSVPPEGDTVIVCWFALG